MFGVRMVISHGLEVLLRPFCIADVPVMVRYFDSMKIHLYTMGMFGQTLENEMEWYEKNRKDPDSCVWAIHPIGSKEPVGVTSLHNINDRDGICSSGIIIWDPQWHGRGVATATHLGRTLFASDFLHRTSIRSTVRTKNPASFKALLRVGYSVWGVEPRCVYKNGEWLDSYHLVWFHPDHVSHFYPDGLPEEYSGGVEKARLALELAGNVVTFP